MSPSPPLFLSPPTPSQWAFDTSKGIVGDVIRLRMHSNPIATEQHHNHLLLPVTQQVVELNY